MDIRQLFAVSLLLISISMFAGSECTDNRIICASGECRGSEGFGYMDPSLCDADEQCVAYGFFVFDCSCALKNMVCEVDSDCPTSDYLCCNKLCSHKVGKDSRQKTCCKSTDGNTEIVCSIIDDKRSPCCSGAGSGNPSDVKCLKEGECCDEYAGEARPSTIGIMPCLCCEEQNQTCCGGKLCCDEGKCANENLENGTKCPNGVERPSFEGSKNEAACCNNEPVDKGLSDCLKNKPANTYCIRLEDGSWGTGNPMDFENETFYYDPIGDDTNLGRKDL